MKPSLRIAGYSILRILMVAMLHIFSLAAEPTKADVQIESYTFNPSTLKVAAGTTVTWVNHDMVPHDVTSKDAGFKSDLLAQDETFSYTFTKPGTYPYLCVTHPKMTGTVVVQ